MNQVIIALRRFVVISLFCLLTLSCSTASSVNTVVVKKNAPDVTIASPTQPAMQANPSTNKNNPIKTSGEETSKGNNNECVAIINESLNGQGSVNTNQPIAETNHFDKEDETDDEASANMDAIHPNHRKAKNGDEEKDLLEEALLLLDESQSHWTKGEFDDALQILDQAYVLLVEANGKPEVTRQKDDLRLLIAKKILAIYNSTPSSIKGIRGEIPLISNADVEKEIRLFQTTERNFFISSYQRSMIYRPVISAELKKAGLPDELSWLPLVESGFKINALSSARALGLWQFIPSTGYKFGLSRDFWKDERLDFEKSTKAAIAYLKELHAMFGDWLTALAGYNCGEGRIIRTIASQQINYLDNFWDLYHRLPRETARYVPRFLATLLIVKNPQKYGFDLTSPESKCSLTDYETVDTNRSIHLRDVAKKLETSEEIIYILNAELRYKITPNKPYKLKLPQGHSEKMLAALTKIPAAKIPRSSRRSILIRHRVRSGETLGAIARKYKTSVKAICSVNRLSRKRVIYPRQILKIPVKRTYYGRLRNKYQANGTKYHKVKRGDTLSAISQKYGISVNKLKKTNRLKKDMIREGQILKL